MSDTADIVIIGAGPAGMSAALAAAPSGASIVILDDNPLPGGQIWRDGPNAHLPRAALELREKVAACANIRIHNGTRVVALAGERALLLEDAERGWRLEYRKLILCTGARELLLPFPGWTLPGVTGAGGLQALVKGGVPVDGQRVVIAGSGPLLLASAATARANGAKILRIAEQASWAAVASFALKLPRWPNKLLQSFGLYDPAYRADSHVVAALGTDHLEGVRISQGGKLKEIECDRLACGFGLIPNVQLGQALGCKLDDGAIRVDAWQATTRDGVYAAGECTGFGGSEKALVEGRIAGHAAVGEHDRARGLWSRRQRWQGFAEALKRDFALDPRLNQLAQPDTLVCRCEDVPYSALVGKTDWTAAKLASRCGMGACQGRVCGAAAKQLFGWQPPAPRPPFSPARVQTLLQLADD